MATNSSVKKSSIPRATHNKCRLDQPTSKLRGPKPPIPHPHHHHPPSQSSVSKPGPHDGLLKEDEAAVGRSLLELEADHAKMKSTLEDTVREAEERLAAMETLMAEREKRCAANLNAATEKVEHLENQVENGEKMLMANNIDPATGETVQPTEEQKAAVEKVKKVTKGDVSKMREKLHQMNEDSDKYLIDVQSILQEIEELEATSYRVCDTSPLEALSPAELNNLITEVEEAQRKEEKQRKKEKKEDENEEEDEEEEEEEEEDEEEEEEEEEEESLKQQKEDSAQPPAKMEVFITDKKT